MSCSQSTSILCLCVVAALIANSKTQNNFVSVFRHTFEFTCPDKRPITGISSVYRHLKHNTHYHSDRVWEFMCGTTSPLANINSTCTQQVNIIIHDCYIMQLLYNSASCKLHSGWFQLHLSRKWLHYWFSQWIYTSRWSSLATILL